MPKEILKKSDFDIGFHQMTFEGQKWVFYNDSKEKWTVICNKWPIVDGLWVDSWDDPILWLTS